MTPPQDDVGTAWLERVLEALGNSDGAAFLARLERDAPDLTEALAVLYADVADPSDLVGRVVALALAAATDRPADLRLLDRRREVDPGWFQSPRMQGYVCYAERFAGRLAAVTERLDYLAELGITYLHLMPLLQPRPKENDGGYAVMDYRAVNPRLGTMADLSSLAAALRGRGMSLCIDVVVNHTAREHAWAQGWLAGDPAYADFYTAFPTRALPDVYDATIPSVFPDRAPGSFSWVEEALDGAGGWVWTTFWPYQWDLNYANPEVLVAMLREILWLANRGVEIFRVDAVPFLWKRTGTDGQNQPEAHRIMQVIQAVVRLAAPATIFKAEAIVAPEHLVPYLGGHARFRPECQLAYHNQLMVMMWSSLATKDAELARRALERMGQVPAGTSWVTYVRCHDDIGWAVSDVDADSVGSNGFWHRRFLNDFYSGRFGASYARGELFQVNDKTGDARISGSAAALTGVQDAVERADAVALDWALRRLQLVHAVAYGFGGIPLLYMGDELALPNDRTYLDDPELAADNRWMHRPWMDWDAASRRHDPSSVEGRMFGWITRLTRARREIGALDAGGQCWTWNVGDHRVLAWRRHHPRSGNFLGLANFAEDPVVLDASRLIGLGDLEVVLGSDPPDIRDGWIRLPPLGVLWLAET